MKEGLTLKPMSPRLQQRQASMRKMKVKSPEKDTATTAREDDQDSSLSGAPSAGQIQNFFQHQEIYIMLYVCVFRCCNSNTIEIK